MKGFCTEAVCILPKPESLTKRGEGYLRELKSAIYNLRDFLAENEIEMKCFATDEVALSLNLENIKYLQLLTPEDRNYLKVMKVTNAYTQGQDVDNRVYEEVRRKFKVKPGMSQEERFAIIEKRERLAGKLVAANEKLVIDISTKNNRPYIVDSKKGDQRMLFRVNNEDFILSATMSGTPIDIWFLYKDKRLLDPVNKWKL